MFMSRQNTAGENHSIKMANISFENAKNIKPYGNDTNESIACTHMGILRAH